jgi:hypothetical protein
MALPKIIAPEYDLILPSTGKTVRYRPFIVKEEKILLLAIESKDTAKITSAIKQILKGCILTKGIKVETLPTFDIEYIFLNVRKRSVGETIDLIVTCEDDGTTQVPVTINIDDIQVKKDPEHTRDIVLGNDLVLRMKYPSLDEFIKNNFYTVDGESTDTANIDKSFEIISTNIDVIFNKEESWSAQDCTKKELYEFIDSMDTTQFKLVEKFFQTMPVLSYEFEVINPKTKASNPVKLEGLTSFFT